MQCEMCGREGNVVKSIVENSEMEVCDSCSKFGNVLKKKVFFERKKSINDFRIIRKDYFKLIKNSREKLKLRQEEVAEKMKIKESIVHKVENGVMEPSIELAEKFEKFFNLKLIENYSEQNEFKINKNIGNVTIGDLLKEKD